MTDLMLETEPHAVEIPADPAERDAMIDAAMERLRDLEGEVARNNEIAQMRIDPILQWRDTENARLAGDLSFWRQRIEALAVGYDFGKKRSRNLPSGTFGLRKSGGGLEILDKTAALEFAKAHGLPLTESVGKTALKEWHESTGLVPEGCEIVPVIDSFYVKVGA